MEMIQNRIFIKKILETSKKPEDIGGIADEELKEIKFSFSFFKIENIPELSLGITSLSFI